MSKLSIKSVKRINTSVIAYNVLIPLLFPIVLFITLRDAVRRKGGFRFIKQRLGFAYPNYTRQPIWLHAASVGEINAAVPLLKELKNTQPNLPILVTTGTPTGSQILKQKNLEVEHIYLPMDYSYAIKKFLNKTHPYCALIMETELWPNLYKQCYKRQIPILIINGRLSDKTKNTANWLHKLYYSCLQQTTHIYARNNEDKQAFIKLGAESDKVTILGNLKFSRDNSYNPSTTQNPLNRKYILAASTHENEEFLIASTWKQLRAWKKIGKGEYILVIVPRHPERQNAILKSLQTLNLNIAIRSNKDSISEKTDLYLADTMGELMMFMQYAELVFMGGSLIPHGGQNILEPARLGKAIITGPHMHNFEDELKHLLSANAIKKIQNSDELKPALDELLHNKQLCSSLGHAAATVIDEHKKIAENYAEKINSKLSQIKTNASNTTC